MRKNYIFLLTAASVLLLSGCLKEEELDGNKPLDLEPMTFFAEMESGADTKTMIEGNVGDAVRYLKWLPEDKIGVYNAESNKFETFVNVNEEASSTAVFEGVNSVQDVYYAVYPYSESHSYAKRDMIMTVDLPAVQKYSTGSFGLDANPMVALAGQGEKFFFQNLCGVLVINITGEASVKSLSVTLFDESGNPAAVSGKHTVSMDYIESPTLASTEESKKTVTLDCGEGVALNTSEQTPFHVVLPAGTYSGIMVSVFTTDGRIMVKQGKNSLRIRRSRVTSAGSFIHESVGVDVDLSDRGTSNCYIISGSGVYSFDANVIGNGESGFVEDAGFHTDSPIINPSIVELLWEDKPGVVQSVGYNDGKVLFYSLGTEGNALIAAKDESGDIVWSWHIWSTDLPENQVYVNSLGEYTLMDRNLGAISDTGETEEEWAESVGMLYQWGRKDPLLGSADGSRTFATTAPVVVKDNVKVDSPIEYSFANPVHVVDDLMNNDSAWGRTKTMYDPCPPGWRVPDGGPDGVWSGFVYGSPGIEGGQNIGHWIVNPPYSTPATTYPAPGYTDGTCGLNLYFPGSALYCWSCDVYNTSRGYGMHLFDRIERELKANKDAEFSVRCMREHPINVSLNTKQATNVTKTSADIHGSMGYLGEANISEMGFVWSNTSSSPDINCSKVCVEVSEGEFSHSLTGLTPGTTYYVRTFVSEYDNILYGPIVSFTTQTSAGNENIPEGDEYEW